MKKIIYVILFGALGFFIQCQEEMDTTFLITNDSVGKLNKINYTAQLDSIFALDSIVGVDGFQMKRNRQNGKDPLGITKDSSNTKRWTTSKKIQIYEKGGKHLLTLTQSNDSLPKIENVRIMDSRFVTAKGIGLQSTFKDVKAQYGVKRVITTMNNVVIYLKESNLYVTIDKKELPPSLRYATSTNIEAVQIPDKAKLKYLMVGWD